MFKFNLSIGGVPVSVIAENKDGALNKANSMGLAGKVEITGVEEVETQIQEPVDAQPEVHPEDKVDDQGTEDAEWKRRFG